MECTWNGPFNIIPSPSPSFPQAQTFSPEFINPLRKIQYHAEFEKSKGLFTAVSDTPENMRIKHNTQIQSNVNYWGVKEQREKMESLRPNESVDDVTRRSRNPGKISDYDPDTDGQFASPYEQRNSANVIYDSQRGEGPARSPGHTANQRSSHAYAPFSYGGGGGNHAHRSSYGDQPPPPPPEAQPQGYGGQSRSSYGESQQAPYSYSVPGRDLGSVGSASSVVVAVVVKIFESEAKSGRCH
ncbi:LIM and sh3 domain protein lasp [Plakobranchus ocellatus]|uniref:LIM and sh3 domain protein lasp n=1 Tax=Plakobranchus ocellatus TaxID=259542 RepID=A0AAV4D5Z3_9GAST|nr:LIM and sh3 domain protein lasp [Plakobranchus ocellatus]